MIVLILSLSVLFFYSDIISIFFSFILFVISSVYPLPDLGESESG